MRPHEPIRIPRPHPRGAVLAAAFIVLAAATCSSPTGPRFIAVQLGSISVTGLALDSKRLLEITGAPADTSYRLPPSRRLRAQVTTSAGDVEEISFAPQLCGGDRTCHSLLVTMDESRDVAELAPLFDSLPARFHLGVVRSESGDTVHVSKSFASISVYDPVDVPLVTRRIREQPGVMHVEASGVGGIIGPPIRWRVLALRPAARSAVVPNDGTLQFQTGDTITVWYAQPDGSTLEATAVAP